LGPSISRILIKVNLEQNLCEPRKENTAGLGGEDAKSRGKQEAVGGEGGPVKERKRGGGPITKNQKSGQKNNGIESSRQRSGGERGCKSALRRGPGGSQGGALKSSFRRKGMR